MLVRPCGDPTFRRGCLGWPVGPHWLLASQGGPASYQSGRARADWVQTHEDWLEGAIFLKLSTSCPACYCRGTVLTYLLALVPTLRD
jgi:hypothetical protein